MWELNKTGWEPLGYVPATSPSGTPVVFFFFFAAELVRAGEHICWLQRGRLQRKVEKELL